MSTNFLVFDVNETNIINDSEYNSSTARLNGVSSGLAQSALHNKVFRQASVMIAAIGEVLSNAGETVSDADYAGLVTSIADVFLGISAIENITTSTTLDGDDNKKFIIADNTITLGFDVATTLGSGWYIYIHNKGTGIVTLDPSAAELIDGAATLNLQPGQSCMIMCDGVGFYTVGRQSKQKIAILEDRKTTGTNGGTFTSGAWRTRDLNTEVIDDDNLVSISSNQFTLVPGKYKIHIASVIGLVNTVKPRLYNVTDSAVVNEGINAYHNAAVNGNTIVSCDFYVNIAASKAFELQMQCQTTGATTGFGSATVAWSPAHETYTQIVIEQLEAA